MFSITMCHITYKLNGKKLKKKISQQLIGSTCSKPNISLMIKPRVQLCRTVATPTPAQVLPQKPTHHQKPTTKDRKPPTPDSPASPSHTSGRGLPQNAQISILGPRRFAVASTAETRKAQTQDFVFSGYPFPGVRHFLIDSPP